METTDIIRAINKASALLTDLHSVPSTHATLSQMEVADFQHRISRSIAELGSVREQIVRDHTDKGPDF